MGRSTKFRLMILNYTSQILTLDLQNGEELYRSQLSVPHPQSWDLLDKKMLLMGVYKSVSSVEAEKYLRDILLSNIVDYGLAASCLFILSIISKGKISRLVNLRNTFLIIK